MRLTPNLVHLTLLNTTPNEMLGRALKAFLVLWTAPHDDREVEASPPRYVFPDSLRQIVVGFGTFYARGQTIDYASELYHRHVEQSIFSTIVNIPVWTDDLDQRPLIIREASPSVVRGQDDWPEDENVEFEAFQEDWRTRSHAEPLRASQQPVEG